MNPKPVALGCALSVLLVAALFGLFVLIAPYYSTLLVWAIRESLFFWLTVAAVLVVLAVLAGAVSIYTDRRGWYEPPARVALPAAALALAAVVGAFVYVLGYHGYQQGQAYAASVVVHEPADVAPALGQRAPFQVASAQARPNLGETTGDIAGTAYLPRTDTYGTLVTRRGWFTGYETLLAQQIPLTGRGSGARCDFAEVAGARDGGWWGNNLGRRIAEERRWVSYSSDDVYAYCDNGVPEVVVPLKAQEGWLVVTQVPAGVAIYDGATDQLTFADAATLPGPSYPLSLAASQRESTTALGTFADYVFGRAGWETTEEDVNSGNATEFVLPRLDGGEPTYVTPLTGRGSATAISALSYMAGTPVAGQRSPLHVHRITPWVSISAIDQRIRADYQDIPNWQALRIMELAPVNAEQWVATIGNDQNVLYRVTGQGNLQGPQATCLLRADGSLIRCGTLADQNGAGVGTQYGQPGPVGAPGPDADLARRLDDAAQAVQDARNRLVGGG